jgi:hypothetical protein
VPQLRPNSWLGLDWVLVAVCAVLLFAYGAAIVVAPITVPLLFISARPSASIGYRVAAGVVAMLTITAVVYVATLVSFGRGRPLIWLLPALAALAIGVGIARASRPSSRTPKAVTTTWLEWRGRDHKLLTSLVAGAFGVGVVLAVRYGRHWAENTPHDCRTFSDCSDPFILRWFALALMVGTASVIVMALLFGLRALLVVPVSLLAQGLVMLLVAYANDYSVPPILEFFIAAGCWGGIALALGSPRSPQPALD